MIKQQLFNLVAFLPLKCTLAQVQMRKDQLVLALKESASAGPKTCAVCDRLKSSSPTDHCVGESRASESSQKAKGAPRLSQEPFAFSSAV